MNYWHIQLHPDDRGTFDTEKIKKILIEKSVIGLGDWEKGENTIQQFNTQMVIGDIVAVKQGSTPIALVRVSGNPYPEPIINEDLDWFPNRRKIDIIDIYEPSYNFTIPQPRGTLSICKDLNTETAKVIIQWYRKAIIKQLMENIKLSAERQSQIKTLWDKFKSETKEEDKKINNKGIDDLTIQWQQYKDKIMDGTLSLDDYTNTLGNSTAIMPGGYLCNFLERTTRTVLGSSKPGNAENFEVKLNNDNQTYFIKSQNKPNANRQEAETYFNDHIKNLLKNIVSTSDPLEKIRLIEETSYSAKQILMKLAVLDNLSDFLHIYSTQWLDELYNEFIDSDADSIFTKNYQICVVAKKLLDVNDKDQNELILLSRFLWRFVNSKSIADTNNPNVILYGPPGTGKTFYAKNSLDFVCQGDTSRYEILQFHPSFTYEDFIEGINLKVFHKTETYVLNW